MTRLTKKGLPDRRGKCRKPGSGGARPNSGRRPIYGGATKLVTFRLSEVNVERIRFEAIRRGLSSNRLVNEWAASLPPSPAEKTAEMQERYSIAQQLRKADL